MSRRRERSAVRFQRPGIVPCYRDRDSRSNALTCPARAGRGTRLRDVRAQVGQQVGFGRSRSRGYGASAASGKRRRDGYLARGPPPALPHTSRTAPRKPRHDKGLREDTGPPIPRAGSVAGLSDVANHCAAFVRERRLGRGQPGLVVARKTPARSRSVRLRVTALRRLARLIIPRSAVRLRAPPVPSQSFPPPMRRF